jgi:response regulator RpfG family c-di-GMP phosphodiesterase
MTAKILFVDDEQNVLDGYQRNLRKRFSIDTATSGEQALRLMSERAPYAVLVADMQMPAMDGIEFLVRAKQRSPDSVRIMLTGNADQKTAVEAVNQGRVYQFLTKPCSPDALGLVLENALRQYEFAAAERELLEKTLNGSINMLTGILASAEPQSFGRGEHLRDYVRIFTRSMNLSGTWELELAAMLSQIGYVTVPPRVTEKVRNGGPLTAAEENVVTRIPEVGAALLRHIPRLESVSSIVLYQKKNYDGSGFPADSVAAEQIPIGSRVLRVLSDMAELEGTGLTKAKALEQMQMRTGWYDPQVLDRAFICFDIYLSTPTAARSASRPVKLKELMIGQTLTANIETIEGVLIVCAGTRLSQIVLEKLRNFQELQGVREPIHVAVEEWEALSAPGPHQRG